MRNEGSRLLGSVKLDQGSIATELGVSRPLVAHWLSGIRKPGAANRDALAKAYGISAESWDREAGKPATGRGGGGGDATMETGAATGAGAIKSLEASLAETLGRLEAVSLDDLSPQGRLQHLNIKVKVMTTLAKVRGEGVTVDEAKILRLPAWRRVVEVVLGACVPWPEAQAAIARALREMGGES